MTQDKDRSPLLRLNNFKAHFFLKYLVTFLIVLVALLLHINFYDTIEGATFIFFYPAVILACLFGDGISAIILSSASIVYYLLEPREVFQIAWPNDYIKLGIFLVSSFLVRMIVRQQVLAKLQAEATVSLLNEEKKSREEFVSMLSHDLQTPLTAIKMKLQMLERRVEDPDNLDLLRRAIKSSNRMQEMIENFLDVSRLNAGRQLPLRISLCNLHNTAESALQSLSLIHGDHFRLTGSADIKGNWSCDAVQRIIENLCNNAIKYGKNGGNVNVSIDRAPEGALITVHNWGNPMSQAEIDNLFKPFERLKKEDRGTVKGWGLGLALVKGLVEAHGGTVKCESSEADGTLFTVYLPYKD